MNESRSFLTDDDRDLEVLHALARADARLDRAELMGIGVEEAREAREAAYASAVVFFLQGAP